MDQETLNRLLEFRTLIQAELLAVIPVVVGLLWKRIKSAVGPERADTLTSFARVAVFAAEELGHKNGKVGEEVSGREKLAFALSRLEELAKGAKVKVNEDEARALLEAVLNESRPYTQLPEALSAGAPEPEMVTH